MRHGKKRKSKTVAPAVVYFTQWKNERDVMQICVVAECTYGGTKVGPIWSHSDKAIRRALAQLTTVCECGRRFHKRRFSEGHRVMKGEGDD